MFTVNPPCALWALIAALLALALFVNGVAMIGTPLSWYGFIPGVAATGPFNEHSCVTSEQRISPRLCRSR